MKITMVLEREIEAVSLRSAWLISRACKPGCESPISPSISALGVSAATEFDDQHVDRARTHQGVGDLERLLASVGLGNQEVVEVDAEFARIDGVERMFGVDKSANPALLLGFRDHVQRERCLARGFWSINFDYPPARQAANAERDVEAERPRRYCLDFDRLLVLAQAHDRTLAERPFDLRQSGVERLGLVHAGPFHEAKIGLAHNHRPSLTGSVQSAIAVFAAPWVRGLCTRFVRARKFFFCGDYILD